MVQWISHLTNNFKIYVKSALAIDSHKSNIFIREFPTRSYSVFAWDRGCIWTGLNHCDQILYLDAHKSNIVPKEPFESEKFSWHYFL